MNPLEIKVREAIGDNYAKRARINYPSIVIVDSSLMNDINEAILLNRSLEEMRSQLPSFSDLRATAAMLISTHFPIEKIIDKIRKEWTAYDENFFQQLMRNPRVGEFTGIVAGNAQVGTKILEKGLTRAGNRAKIVKTFLELIEGNDQITNELIYRAIRKAYTEPEYTERFREDKYNPLSINVRISPSTLPNVINQILFETMKIHFNNQFLERDCETIYH